VQTADESDTLEQKKKKIEVTTVVHFKATNNWERKKNFEEKKENWKNLDREINCFLVCTKNELELVIFSRTNVRHSES
jgi:hypothetical protein